MKKYIFLTLLLSFFMFFACNDDSLGTAYVRFHNSAGVPYDAEGVRLGSVAYETPPVLDAGIYTPYEDIQEGRYSLDRKSGGYYPTSGHTVNRCEDGHHYTITITKPGDWAYSFSRDD